MAVIHLVEGPVGAGKSTYAARLSAQHQAARLNLDEWMVILFSPDSPGPTGDNFMEWYGERKQRCIEQIWHITCDLMDTDNDAILELGLIQKQNRQDFYSRVDAQGYDLRMIVLDTPKEMRWQRIQQRNEQQGDTYKMAVSEEVFEMANSMWQPPDEQEIAEREIEFIGPG